MKNAVLIFLIISSGILQACQKKSGCESLSPDVEYSAINDFTIKNSLSLAKHNSGIYYNVIDSGSGTKPSVNSKVSIVYTGRFLNNRIFDSIYSPKLFHLSELIEGLKTGLPLIKKGGRMELVIPSSYAYGCTGNANLNVPSNTVLYFDITLVDVQ